MPFISKDWRSPGEIWVKTNEGWEKKKILECSDFSRKENVCDSTVTVPVAPHCQILTKPTKEIAGFNEFHEAVKRLDFCNAVRDARRFNYICALLNHLIGEHSIYLSGCSRKVLLAVVEEIAKQVFESKNNPHSLRRLIMRLDSMIAAEKDTCWGGPHGSQLLWHQHANKINDIVSIANRLQFDEQPSISNQPLLLQLPEECIREIILRLSTHEDLASSAKACVQLDAICNEQRIWKELTTFYFTSDEIKFVVSEKHFTDWKVIYDYLKKMYGIREERQFAETLSLCRHCRCLFWESLGHPCIADQCPEYRARLKECGGPLPPSPVPPSAFLKFFSL